jgi:deoxyribose-phosphate aldolase
MLAVSKAFEAKASTDAGADEVDMVINVGWMKAGDLKAVYDDVKAVVDSVPSSVCVKAILEVCLLTDEQIVQSAMLCALAGVTFVKTSTGFSTGGATVTAVELMRAAVGSSTQIKAAGGIKSRDDALRYIAMGVTRIGTSCGIALLSDNTTPPSAASSY